MPEQPAGANSDTRLPSGERVASGAARWHSRLVWLIVLLWAALMSPLLRWGLPNRANDAYLFGGEPAWDAARFDAARALRERQQRAAGADTDLNPLATRDRVANLTPDEASRAEILRRYRLFSCQPDEMITFMALQRMQPPHFEKDPATGQRSLQFDLDPKLYQYGGGYIYLIVAALAGASALGFTRLTSDIGVYLAQPEMFAMFYVVARCVTLAFGALLLVAVWKLARRTAGNTAAWLALLFVACTPVFITGVLEAKPHLPSACLLLWAILSALDYHARGRARDAVRTGILAGYALGMVITGVVGLILWPILLVSRWRAVRAVPAQRNRLIVHLLLTVELAVGVYLVTNPYVPYNFIHDRQSLSSNAGNTLAMYANQASRVGAGAIRTGELLLEGCGVAALLAGLAGLVLWLRQRPRETILVSAAGLALLVVCALLFAGKPAEYGRFLVLPVSLLSVGAGCAAGLLARRRRAWALVLAVAVLLPMRTLAYVRAFAADACGTDSSRRTAAAYLQRQLDADDAVAVLQEPAPYAVPPLNFTGRNVFWLPPARPADLDARELPPWLVFTADDARTHVGAWWTEYYDFVASFPPENVPPTPIAWADKPVFVWRRALPPR